MNRGSRTGISRGSRLGVRRNSGLRQPDVTTGIRATLREWIAEFRALFLFFLAIILLSWLHLESSPWERVLGLAHGQELSAPQGRFLAFDHLSPESAETLSRHLFVENGSQLEVVSVQGYGMWRFGLLMALCYGLCLFTTRSLLRFRFRSFFSQKDGSADRIDRRLILLLSTVLGVGAGLLGMRNIGPTLFSFTLLATLVAAAKREPNFSKVNRNLEFLELSRFFWLGWLLPQTLSSTASVFPQFWWNSVGLLVGGAAAFLAGKRSFTLTDYFTTRGSDKRELQQAWKRSFDLGCWEVFGLTIILGLSLLSGAPYFYGTIFVLGAFGWGRLAQTFVLRILLFKSPPIAEQASTFRVLTGVWFLLPVVVGPFLHGYDQTALMLWLSVLVPLTVRGRPWGTTKLDVQSPSDSIERNFPVARPELLAKVTPHQQAAIIIMSLPPEMSAQLFSELDAEEVQDIALEITHLPSICPELRSTVIHDFLDSSGLPNRPDQNGLDFLERLVKERATKVAELIKSRLLKNISNDTPEVDESASQFNQLKRAAVVLRSLGHELSQEVVKYLDGEVEHGVKFALKYMQKVRPAQRMWVLRDLFKLREFRNFDWEKGPDELRRFCLGSQLRLANEIERHYFPSGYVSIPKGKKKRHICTDCLKHFEHGIGLRKHQRQTGHSGSLVVGPKS